MHVNDLEVMMNLTKVKQILQCHIFVGLGIVGQMNTPQLMLVVPAQVMHIGHVEYITVANSIEIQCHCFVPSGARSIGSTQLAKLLLDNSFGILNTLAVVWDVYIVKDGPLG